MTEYEALVLVVGARWADRLWPTVRDRPGLIHEIAEIAPRWRVRLSGEGQSELYDAAAPARAAWVSARDSDIEEGPRRA